MNIRKKLSDLEDSTSDLSCPPLRSIMPVCTVELSTYQPTTEEEISNIMKNSKITSCSLDPIPSDFLMNFLPETVPVITNIVNKILISGSFTECMKSAIVRPLIKKINMDKEILKNYRPVSNLSFLSKVVEKVIAKRLINIW